MTEPDDALRPLRELLRDVIACASVIHRFRVPPLTDSGALLYAGNIKSFLRLDAALERTRWARPSKIAERADRILRNTGSKRNVYKTEADFADDTLLELYGYGQVLTREEFIRFSTAVEGVVSATLPAYSPLELAIAFGEYRSAIGACRTRNFIDCDFAAVDSAFERLVHALAPTLGLSDSAYSAKIAALIDRVIGRPEAIFPRDPEAERLRVLARFRGSLSPPIASEVEIVRHFEGAQRHAEELLARVFGPANPYQVSIREIWHDPAADHPLERSYSKLSAIVARAVIAFGEHLMGADMANNEKAAEGGIHINLANSNFSVGGSVTNLGNANQIQARSDAGELLARLAELIEATSKAHDIGDDDRRVAMETLELLRSRAALPPEKRSHEPSLPARVVALAHILGAVASVKEMWIAWGGPIVATFGG
jgi:hypothetical protein